MPNWRFFCAKTSSFGCHPHRTMCVKPMAQTGNNFDKRELVVGQCQVQSLLWRTETIGSTGCAHGNQTCSWFCSAPPLSWSLRKMALHNGSLTSQFLIFLVQANQMSCKLGKHSFWPNQMPACSSVSLTWLLWLQSQTKCHCWSSQKTTFWREKNKTHEQMIIWSTVQQQLQHMFAVQLWFSPDCEIGH